MNLKKDITLDNLCSIYYKIMFLARLLIFGEKVSIETKEKIYTIVEKFALLITLSDIQTKRIEMCDIWDSTYSIVQEIIKTDGDFVVGRSFAFDIYNIIQPIELERTK